MGYSEDTFGRAILRCAVVACGMLVLAMAALAIFDVDGCRTKAIANARRPLEEGVEAGRLGLPPQACPYSQTWNQEDKREMWLKGWAEGRASAEKSR